MEVEEMVNKVREQQGRPFDVKQLTTLCVANVIINMLFGHRCGHSDQALQQLITDISERASSFSMIFEIFPTLRLLPYFKKYLRKNLARAKNIFSFLNTNIAKCIEVCDFYFHSASLQVAMQSAVNPSVRPSVCLSVKTTQVTIMRFSLRCPMIS